MTKQYWFGYHTTGRSAVYIDSPIPFYVMKDLVKVCYMSFKLDGKSECYVLAHEGPAAKQVISKILQGALYQENALDNPSE